MKKKGIMVNSFIIFYCIPVISFWYCPASTFHDALQACIFSSTALPIMPVFTWEHEQSLRISDVHTSLDVFTPSLGEEVDIIYTLYSYCQLNIKIYDVHKKLVKDLVTSAAQEPGLYQVRWDGKDNFGKIVSDGVYYFIIEDTLRDRVEAVYDPTNSGGKDISREVQLQSTVCNTVKNEPAVFTYTLPRSAYVTLCIRQEQQSGPVIKILHYKSLQGRGAHTVSWDGRDEFGNIVDARQYGVGIWADTLVDNAIIVQRPMPRILNVKATPIKFKPMAISYTGNEQAMIFITFDLSCDANVTIAAYDGDNQRVVNLLDRVATKQGCNSLIWCGKNDYGQFLPPGGYRIEIQACDEALCSDVISAYAEIRY